MTDLNNFPLAWEHECLLSFFKHMLYIIIFKGTHSKEASAAMSLPLWMIVCFQHVSEEGCLS